MFHKGNSGAVIIFLAILHLEEFTIKRRSFLCEFTERECKIGERVIASVDKVDFNMVIKVFDN